MPSKNYRVSGARFNFFTVAAITICLRLRIVDHPRRKKVFLEFLILSVDLEN